MKWEPCRECECVTNCYNRGCAIEWRGAATTARQGNVSEELKPYVDVIVIEQRRGGGMRRADAPPDVWIIPPKQPKKTGYFWRLRLIFGRLARRIR